jgi:sulfur carrier protein
MQSGPVSHEGAYARGGLGVILLNGERSDLAPGATVAAVLERLGLELDARGVAVAVDGEVVPRAAWVSFSLGGDARVEVLTAMQGG